MSTPTKNTIHHQHLLILIPALSLITSQLPSPSISIQWLVPSATELSQLQRRSTQTPPPCSLLPVQTYDNFMRFGSDSPKTEVTQPHRYPLTHHSLSTSPDVLAPNLFLACSNAIYPTWSTRTGCPIADATTHRMESSQVLIRPGFGAIFWDDGDDPDHDHNLAGPFPARWSRHRCLTRQRQTASSFRIRAP